MQSFTQGASMKLKSIFINYKGRKIQIEGFDTGKFIYYCDLSISVKPFNHTIKRVMYICEVKTSIGNKVAILCASCYQKFKTAKWINALIERKVL